MPSNIGTQTVTLLYHTAANSLEWNRRFIGIRKIGIYSGGWLTVINNTTAQISPLICEISDSIYQVRIKTDIAVNVSVNSTISYIVLRWVYTGSATDDFMALSAVATPAANDLVVGKCTFNGSGFLNGFTYGDVTYPRSDPATQDMFLKVEATGDSDLRVRIRSGRIQTTSGNIMIADQKSDLFIPPAADSKVYLVCIDIETGAVLIDSSGLAAVTPVPPDYAGKIVIAEVTLSSTNTSISQNRIKDVRGFISKVPETPVLPPNTITAQTMRIEASGAANTWVQAKLTALQISQGWFCTGGGLYIPAFNDNQACTDRPILDGSGWEGYNTRFGITVYAQCVKLTLATV